MVARGEEASPFESSQMLAAFLASTPLLSDSWQQCSIANSTAPERFVIDRIGDVAYVAFSGVPTIPVSNWDSSFTQVHAGEGDNLLSSLGRLVHAGFFHMFLSIYNNSAEFSQILATVSSNKAVVFTGHSIGGTIASLATLYLLSSFPSLSSTVSLLCITFGSPLLGNEALSRAILKERWGGRFCHVVSKHDIVPRLLFAPLDSVSMQLNQLLEFWHSLMRFPQRSGKPITQSSDKDVDEFHLFVSDHLAAAEAAAEIEQEEGSSCRSLYTPFGSYLFCSEEGAICINNSTAIVQMLHLLFMTSSVRSSIEEHLMYGNFITKISQQFLKRRGCTQGLCSSGYDVGMSLALQALGMGSLDPAAQKVQKCLMKARHMGRRPNLNSANLAISLSKITPYRAQVEWYKAYHDDHKIHLFSLPFQPRPRSAMAPPIQARRSPSPSQPSGKGEVSDLKVQLRALAGTRSPGTDDSKRDLFKKVISYMTVGIDVSSVFSEMVMCSATTDVVLKKMCYLYVGNYAKCNPDLALLTINFLQKDCRDEDPMIRGLALRSLCSLRVENLVEYLVGPLGSGLQDGNSYVRMVATMGILKLYHISATTCMDSDFPAALKALMLNDPDAQVVANCLSSLQEIWNSEASTSEEASLEREALLSKPVIYYLLNRIRDFSEWAQCLVLDLVSRYIPSDSNEIFDMMNLLEDRLQHANGAVVLATTKVFLHLTMSMTDVHQQVYERIKAPLLTLVSTGSPEQSYAVLSHLHLLVMRAPMLFSSDYKHFYCQYSQPSYVKKLKLEMLTAVANESNTYEIVTELCEYAANVDVPIARESIRAVGKIALQQYDVNAIVDRLLQFLEMEKDYVTAETLVLVKDLLRKYPQWSHDCIAVVGNISSKNVQEPKAKAALIWMLGEYSQDMLDAPYILESLIENWEEEHSAEVRLHLLTAALKCFFRRPPETQKALGAALAAGLADSHQDVHDRALFYYRLLQYDVAVAECVVDPPKQAVSVFADTQSSEVKDRIFDEFNSLSVVYQKPSYMFTDKEHRGPFEFLEELGGLSVGAESEVNVIQAQRFEANDNDLLLGTSEKEEIRVPSNNGSAYSAPDFDASTSLVTMQTPSQTAYSSSTLPTYAPQTSSGIDDLLGLGLPAPAAPSPPLLKLNAKPVLDPSSFQRKWGQLPISLSQDGSISPLGVAALTTPQVLLRHMQGHSIQCIASGGQAPNFKFFFFAQKADDSASFFLVECLINTSLAKAQIKVKADDGNASEAFTALFRSALSEFGTS